jgi:hypothetical protein
MAKILLACLFIASFTSCSITSENKGQIFVNQQLIESSIQSVQPADQIALSIQTTNNRDSTLIVRLTVDPKIPDDNLNSSRAKEVMSSFITILPNLKTFTFCKIIFIKKNGSVISTSRSREFLFHMTPELATRVANYKDSARASIGYIDPNWTYINKDLNLSLKLKNDWYYVSEENDSLVYYSIGSDVNQLPQYRTDEDRKVTFRTLSNLDPGNAYPIFRISKDKMLPIGIQGRVNGHPGPAIFAGLVNNLFLSEDEYLKNVYELLLSRKFTEKEIHSFVFGNATFRGHQLMNTMKDGSRNYNLTVIKRFRSVTLLLSIHYSNEKELEEIKHELSDLKINQL